jgi:hypothetical protein
VVTDGPTAPAGVRDTNARVVPAADALVPENLVMLGRPLRIGALEFTPQSISVSPVELAREQADGTRQTRDGGSGAIRMRVKLRNLSSDRVFAPLDEAFLRESGSGRSECFVETEEGQRIYMYPLPVASDWTILGQEYRELKPGEALETTVVSAADAAPRLTRHMTWRLRLRTGVDSDQTELVGVKFDRSQVR